MPEMKQLTWYYKKFDELDLLELYDLLKLRLDVFVVEQNCPYPELDSKDQIAYHVFGKSESGNIIAVTRILPAGSYFREIAIGRVAVKKEERGKGIGIELMKRSIDFIESSLGKQAIKISAQEYLIHYYHDFGFQQTGESYLEDGIPHVDMLRDI